MSGRIVKRAAAAAAVVAALEVVLLVAWPLIDDNDRVPTLENQLAVLAALCLLALPHALAVLGYRGRPVLLKVAAVVALALGILTLLPVTTAVIGIPLLLVPSFFYFVAAKGAGAGGRISTPVLAVAATLCALGGTAAFFVTEDARCEVERREPGGATTFTPVTCDLADGWGTLGVGDVSYSGTSDVVTFHESLPSLALSIGAFAFCAWGSAVTVPRRSPA